MNKNAVRVSVAGASGYTGAELLRYLSRHPRVELVSCYANSQSGHRVDQLFGKLRGFVSATLEQADWSQVGKDVDLVFLCLPHGESQHPVRQILESGARVVDLGADFRLRRGEDYERTYGQAHRAPELLPKAVYGLPELHRERIREARLVANPGCYPTAALLALLPVLGSDLLSEPTIIDAKSGVSGAGRAAKIGSLFVEVNENFRPYSVGCHRHQPEIEQTVGQKVVFTPHLVPMTRGILATVYVRHGDRPLEERYDEYYAKEPFVRILDEELPETRHVAGTNFCEMAIRPSGFPGCSVVLSAIDNLGKGAAGTAVHNMNLMFGFPEETGLDSPAPAP